MKKNGRPLIQVLCLCLIASVSLSACYLGPPPPLPSGGGSGGSAGGDNNNTIVVPAVPPVGGSGGGESSDEGPTGYDHVFQSTGNALPPSPIPVTITTDDGRTLEGIYYPGAYSPGPVIVLMHWAGGDMRDWDAIAPWLQNRGGQPFGIGDGSSWWDPSWFPELPEWASFSVLVFNFGGFGISQGSRETLALDAKAAVDFASMQSNVDPGLVSTMGASIGADGSVDGCYLHQMDSNSLGTCLGGFSLSPGNFQQDSTNFPYTYAETVQGLLGSGEAMKVAYCLAAQGDGTSPDTCKSVSGYESTYHRYIYPGNAHGMNLIAPDLFPQDPAVNMNALQIYLEFLQEVYQVDFSQ